MKYIFIFTQTLKSGGAEKQAVILANALCENYKVFLIVFYGNRFDAKIVDQINKKVQIIKLYGNVFIKIKIIIQVLYKNRPNFLFNYLLLPNFLGGLIAKFLKNTKSIGGIRSSVLDKKKVLLNKIAHNIINHYTIFNNYTGKEKCTRLGFKESKAIVIPNGINLPQQITLRSNNPFPVIISVGRFEEVKDYNAALKSILELKNRGLDFNYWMVGWGNKEVEIKDTVIKYKLEEIVEIFINPNNLTELYQKADIYLQTSLFEGLSNTVMEAMSYSLPCVVTNVGDNNRLIIDKKTGFLCDVRDFKNMSKKLEILISNYDLRISLGEKGYNHVKENYSTEKLRTNYINLIHSLSEK